MSQKKPTTNQQLEEMRELIANLQPGKVVSVDRELQAQNTTLMLMLYGATAKYGVGMRGDNGVLVTAQVPVLQVPANQALQWEVSEDGKSVMLYIVLNEDVQVEDRPASETSPAVGDTAVGEVGATEETPPPASTSQAEQLADALGNMEDDIDLAKDAGIGDEFEDEVEVGLGD